MESCGEPWNLDDFAVISRGILQTGPQNFPKFSAENCWPYISWYLCAKNVQHTVGVVYYRCMYFVMTYLPHCLQI